MKRTLQPIPFTKEGLEALKKKYEELLATRKDAVLTLKAARELGDLSENGLYKAARARLSSLDNQLTRLSYQIKLAVIPEIQNDIVGIGSKVTVNDGSNERIFQIVGDLEADPKSGKISKNSPIGIALMGRKVGERASASTPAGTVTYTIKVIS